MPQRHYPLAEYFIAELMSPLRHEYLDGDIFTLGGESVTHAAICGNVVAHFVTALRGSTYDAYSSGMRIRTPSDFHTYPDASIVGSPADITRFQETETIGNPVVVVEVLSDSTRDYDRGLKFDLYRAIPTLRDYVLIEQTRIEAEHRYISDGEWTSRTVSGPDAKVRLTGVEMELPLALVYERLTF